MNSTPDAYWQAIGLAAPARRALIGAGIMTIHDVATWHAVDLAQLHGIGVHAMIRLRQALADAQLSFADEPRTSD
ncbi:MAG: DNA-binding protein [Roseiflexaceae bacterium]